MTSIGIKRTVNHVSNIISKYSNQMRPFIFIKNTNNHKIYQQFLTLKINCQMTPFLQGIQKKIRLGIWNLPSLINIKKNNKQFQNYLILNPYKQQQLIKKSFLFGIVQMVVEDIQEVNKIQQCYFELKKSYSFIKQPQYIWSVENVDDGLENIGDLGKCKLDINGLYFKKQIKIADVELIMNNKMVKDKQYSNFRQISMQNLPTQSFKLKKYGIQPMITNYSQINNYIMVCRILGRDQLGNLILQQSTNDFICKPSSCICSNLPLYNKIFQAGGFQWVIVQPKRLDKLLYQHVVQ